MKEDCICNLQIVVMISKFWVRVQSDILMKSRLELYEEILKQAINNGYEIISMLDYYLRVSRNDIKSTDLITINRHDIDNHVGVAKKMYEIEKRLGVSGTYFFRLETLDRKFIKRLANDGFEVGYHFENIANYCKMNPFKNFNDLSSNEISHIQEEFKYELGRIREKFNLPINNVASHGDFVNRILKVPNQTILDSNLRNEMSIMSEAYDQVYFKNSSIYLSDCKFPEVFNYDGDILEDLKLRRYPNIYLLTHPNNWEVSLSETLKDLLFRLTEGILFRLRIASPLRALIRNKALK